MLPTRSKKDQDRASRLCHLAWDQLLNKQESILKINYDDAGVLMRCGARVVHSGKNAKGGSFKFILEYRQHRFLHESDYYVPLPRQY